MTKEEKIQEAWAGFYNPQVKEDGWMDIRPQAFSNDQFFDRLKFNSEKHSIRPKSLQGIENNNGWIKIESEADLPKEEDDYHVYTENGELSISFFDLVDDWLVFCGKITHYQPIVKPKPPIY